MASVISHGMCDTSGRRPPRCRREPRRVTGVPHLQCSGAKAVASPAEWHRPEWAPTSPEWRRVLQEEHDAKVARSSGPDAERFNRTGRRTWWDDHDVDGTLAAYGYRLRIYDVDPARWPVYLPQAQHMPSLPPVHAPRHAASGSSRSGSSGSGGW
jgi:hypothetical protein